MVDRRLRLARVSNASVLHRPLTQFGPYEWYEVEETDFDSRIALLLVDGPPGPTPGGRRGAMEQLGSRLDANSVVIIDDVNRAREREIAETWALQLGLALDVIPTEAARGKQAAILSRRSGTQ
jgi:hypothetical protein